MLGALLLVSPWVRPRRVEVIALLALTFAGDIAVNRVSFRFGIRDTPW